MKVINFKTLCNHISKSVIWNKTAEEFDKDNTKRTRWESDDHAVISISECINLDTSFVIYHPAPTSTEVTAKRGYLSLRELHYVNGLLLRRQSGSGKTQWPLSLTTEMRGGDRYINIKTTFDTKNSESASWKHIVTAFPGEGKPTISYEAESAGTDGTKLHNTLVTRIYKQLIGEKQNDKDNHRQSR